MKTPQLILAALLLATPLLYAQETPAKTETKPTPEPFRVTINLKTTEKGKVTGQKSYMLTATTDKIVLNSQLRDTNRDPYTTSDTGGQFTYSDTGTNVDISNFKTVTNLVCLNLRISTTGAVDSGLMAKPSLPMVPIYRTRQFTIAPTLPIGKLVTVYSAVDAVNDIKMEVQVMVQPLDAK
jgi:hypothetical protein